MSDYFGDIRLGDTIDIKFTTRQISGAPFTLAGSPVISAYPANSTTQLTAGITLSVDFDSVTGYNNVRVVASGGNGYLTATNYDLCITTGTVNSVSVAGESIGSFSIENRSALMPTTAALTLDVSATGEAGVDWANVGGKTTVNALTNTSIITTQKVDVDTIKTNPVVNAGTVTFPTTATLASTTNITAGTITTVTTVTNQLTAAAIATGVWQDATAGDFTTASSIGKALYVSNVVPGAAGGHFIAGTNAATTITGSLTTAFTGSLTGSVASVTGNVGGNVVGSVGSVTGLTASNLDATVSSRLASASYTTPPTANANADALLARNIAGGSSSGRIVTDALRFLRNKWSISGTTLTVCAEDDAATAWTATISTDAAALPITGNDPA